MGSALAIEPPTDPYATPGNTQVELYWEAVSGATSYKVYRSEESGTGYTEVDERTTLWFLDTGLDHMAIGPFLVTHPCAKNMSSPVPGHRP